MGSHGSAQDQLFISLCCAWSSHLFFPGFLSFCCPFPLLTHPQALLNKFWIFFMSFCFSCFPVDLQKYFYKHDAVITSHKSGDDSLIFIKYSVQVKFFQLSQKRSFMLFCSSRDSNEVHLFLRVVVSLKYFSLKLLSPPLMSWCCVPTPR